ncbi:hypothetical protein QPK87_05315 [Kamptonema cortianum]|nr:hypothetical protein [Geitlerinema splendidum]MDK3155996.1 hypothetical protein [Kamptonema cortianum]
MNDFYNKLVDLYAGNELPEELTEEMDMAAMQDAELAHDMSTLKKTVEILQSDSGIPFTEESYYRILMKLQSQGIEIESHSPEPTYMQYHLPMQG